MIKGADAETLSAENDMYFGNFMLAALNVSLIRFLKLKYLESFTYTMHYVHSSASLNQVKGIFSKQHLRIPLNVNKLIKCMNAFSITPPSNFVHINGSIYL